MSDADFEELSEATRKCAVEQLNRLWRIATRRLREYSVACNDVKLAQPFMLPGGEVAILKLSELKFASLDGEAAELSREFDDPLISNEIFLRTTFDRGGALESVVCGVISRSGVIGTSAIVTSGTA